MADIILIGLGGIGCKIVRSTLRMFDSKINEQDKIAGYGIDFDPHEGLQVHRDFGVDNAQAQVNLYWNRDRNFQTHWPSQGDKPYSSVGRIDTTSAAAQIRPNGRLAAITNYTDQEKRGLHNIIGGFFEEQQVLDIAGDGGRKSFKVFIITSLGGGTGSGIMHEVVYSCREYMQHHDFLMGLFLDGTVVNTWGPRKTALMGYASLVEVEHWMSSPKDYYNVPLLNEYSSIWEDRKERKAELGLDYSYLDLSLILSHKNAEDGHFGGITSGHISKDYTELSAGWLYSFLVGDLLSSLPDEDGSKVFENVLINFRAEKFGVGIDGRSHNFGSIGCSMLSVPVKKISEYLTSTVVIDLFDRINQESKPLDDGSKFLSELLMDKDNGQIFNDLRGRSKIYSIIEKMETGAIQKLQTARSWDATRQIASSYKMNTATSHWQTLLTSYNDDLNEISSEFITEKLKQLDDKIGDFLLDHLPASVELWLEELIKRIDVCIKPVENLKQSKSDPWLSTMGTEITNFSTYNAWQKAMKWGQGRDRLLHSIEMFKKQRLKYEAIKIKEKFYTPFKAAIILRVQVLNKLNSKITETIEEQRVVKSGFTKRDWILDSEKLTNKEHPLELEIGTHENYVLEGEKKLKQKLNIKTILIDLMTPCNLPKSGIQWDSFKTYYKKIVELRSSELIDSGSLTESDTLYDDIQAGLNGFIEERVLTDVIEVISETFSLEEALFSFLEDKFAIAQNYNPKTVNSKLTKDAFESHFGKDGAATLLNSKDKSIDKWSKLALAFLVKRLSIFSAPFWKQDQTRARDTENKVSITSGRRHQFIYVQSNEIRTTLNNHNNIKGDEFKVHNFKDKHTMAIVQLIAGYPLSTVTSFNDQELEYKNHCKRWSKGLETEPFHVDSRFYGEWRDELSTIERGDRKLMDHIFTVYLLGVGCGSITGGKGTKKYIFDGKSLAPTLPKFITKLQKNEKLVSKIMSEINIKIDTTLVQAKRGQRDAMDVIWKYYYKGLSDVKGIKPPKTNTNNDAYPLWESLVNAGEMSSGSDGVWKIEGRLVPRDKDGFIELAEIMNQYI